MERKKDDDITELLTRGVDAVLVRDHLEKRLRSVSRRSSPLRVKLGIDPTSPNIHLGRTAALLKLRDFQELGHTIVLIIGDFTGVIGDTSDKTAERPMLERSVVEKNATRYLSQCARILDMEKTEVMHNSSWLDTLSYREITKQANAFSLAEFVARSNIRERLDAGKHVSLREILYPLMQGYDSVHVRSDVELGGRDQWFNLLAGRTLQQQYGQEPQDILTTNIIVGTDGRKMSSSWGNTINILDEPNDMYGKVMSIPDILIIPYFVHVTRVSMNEIMELETNLKSGSVNPRDIKMRLALEITKQYGGSKKAKEAERHFISIFQKKETPDDIQHIHAERGEELVVFLVRIKLVSSKSEGHRLLKQGAIEFNGVLVRDSAFYIQESGVLRVGKKVMIQVDAQ